jgi:hypothetical protein
MFDLGMMAVRSSPLRLTLPEPMVCSEMFLFCADSSISSPFSTRILALVQKIVLPTLFKGQLYKNLYCMLRLHYDRLN